MRPIQIQPIQRGLKPGHMPVVIGSPYVYAQIKAPLLQLVAVVSNVCRKIRIEAIGPAEHIILQIKLIHLLLGFPLG